jgi:hypothetical protein
LAFFFFPTESTGSNTRLIGLYLALFILLILAFVGMTYDKQKGNSYSKPKPKVFQAFVNGKTRTLKVVSSKTSDKVIDVDEKYAIATRSKATGRESGWPEAFKYLPTDSNQTVGEFLKEVKESNLSQTTKDLILKKFKLEQC